MRKFAGAACIAAIISVAPFVTDARADAISLNAGMTYQFGSEAVSENGTSTTLQALGEFDVTVSDMYTDFLITLTNDTELVSEVQSIFFDFQGELGSYRFKPTRKPPITVPEYDASASLLLVGMAFVAAFGAGARR